MRRSTVGGGAGAHRLPRTRWTSGTWLRVGVGPGIRIRLRPSLCLKSLDSPHRPPYPTLPPPPPPPTHPKPLSPPPSPLSRRDMSAVPLRGTINWKTGFTLDSDGSHRKLTQAELERLRRERNRLHAKMTRDRKKVYVANVEQTIAGLEEKNAQLRRQLGAYGGDGDGGENGDGGMQSPAFAPPAQTEVQMAASAPASDFPVAPASAPAPPVSSSTASAIMRSADDELMKTGPTPTPAPTPTPDADASVTADGGVMKAVIEEAVAALSRGPAGMATATSPLHAQPHLFASAAAFSASSATASAEPHPHTAHIPTSVRTYPNAHADAHASAHAQVSAASPSGDAVGGSGGAGSGGGGGGGDGGSGGGGEGGAGGDGTGATGAGAKYWEARRGMLALPPTTFAPIGGGAAATVSMATTSTTTTPAATMSMVAATATTTELSAPVASTTLTATSVVSIGSTYVVTKDDMSVEPRPGLSNGPSATDIKDFAAQGPGAAASSFRQAL